MILGERFVLSNGVYIPKIGLGTWFMDDETVAKAITQAVAMGYRLIDTAQAYQNEVGVGIGLKNCGVPRSELFVTSKVAAQHKTYEEAAASIDESLEKMGLYYVDLMIIHSPQPWNEWRSDKRYFEENIEVWRALEDAYKQGKVKAIGVSNFLIDDLENLLNSCEIEPMVNQVLTHIGNNPTEIVEYCQSKGILVEAYSPIAHGEAFKNEEIKAMAKKYGVSVAKLCIRFVLDLGLVALPKTANPAHMLDNLEVEFAISQGDMEYLGKVHFGDDYGEFTRFPVFSGR